MEPSYAESFTAEDQSPQLELKSEFIPHGWRMVSALGGAATEFYSTNVYPTSVPTLDSPRRIAAQQMLPIEISE